MAEKQQIVDLLKALSSPENATRQKAETMYQQAKQTGPDTLMIGMVQILGSPEVEEAIRRQDAVLLRQQMGRGSEKDFVFARVSPQVQQTIAEELLNRFEQEQNPKLQAKIGEVVSKLAEYVCDKSDPRGSLAPGNPCGWPALLPRVFMMADASKNPSPDSCESALRLLKDIVSTMQDDIVGAQQQLGQVIQAGVSAASVKIRTSVLLLICEIVGETEKKAWAPLLATAPMLLQVMTQLCQANEEDLLQESIQALTEVASIEPDFFKPLLQQQMEPARFMAGVARSKEADSGLRNLAVEWLVTYLEKRTKWLTKNLKDFAPLALEACMELMLEVEDGEEALKTWATRMDDEEGDEDEDELFHTGEEAIDRVVEAVQMESLGTSLFTLVGNYVSQAPWQAKHAALAAVKQTVEYVEDQEHVNQMASLLMQHVDHPHPRVRYTALHAIGQLANDQSPTFQDSFHKQVMPILLTKMDDPVDRVAAMAMSAFVSFGEELDTSLMSGYARGFMEKLVQKLQASQHRGVREESITSIAVIAGVIEKDFSQYYDGIMPMLKQFVMHATSDKENRLRGKSFECMSLLGLAVGKEKFLPDAREALQQMMTIPLEADDVQREYIKEASERICQCLKKDFAPFLPNLLPGIFRTLRLDDLHESKPTKAGGDGAVDDDDDDEYIRVMTGDGKQVVVRTQKFEEMMESVQLLHTFCTELEGAYFDWVPPTAEVLLPLLSASDEVSMLCDEVRGVALQTWGLLIKCARVGAQERGQPLELAGTLFRTGLDHIMRVLEKNDDLEMLSETASGITECVKSIGSGVLNAVEIQQLVERTFALMDQSFARTQQSEAQKKSVKAADIAALGQTAEDDEDDDEDSNEEEDQLRRSYSEVLGAIMQVAPAEFMPCLSVCGQRIATWLATKENKALGLYFACDLIEHLKENSQSLWPEFMPHILRSLTDGEADLRTPAAYAVNLAATIPAFADAAPQVFGILHQILSTPKPKKRDEKAMLAWDNAVAALLSMARHQSVQCPPQVNPWQLVISKLPIRDDEDEAKKVHDKVADLVLEQNMGLLGGPDRTNLGPVLGVMAEVHHNENLCSKDTDEKIVNIFKLIPRELLGGLAGGFTEKQQKKIEKMLAV